MAREYGLTAITDVDQANTHKPPPWGYLATFGWVALAVTLSVPAGLAALVAVRPDLLVDTTGAREDGVLLSVSVIVSAVIYIAVLALAARLARWPVAEYLGLVRPSNRHAAIGVAALALLLLAFQATNYLLSADVGTFQVDTYRSARDTGALPLFLFAAIFVAPLYEEIVFRGFLYRGWVRSGRTAMLGILIITALFAITHVRQTNWYGIVQVFLIGLLLGWARWLSGSTILTIQLHTLSNSWAIATQP